MRAPVMRPEILRYVRDTFALACGWCPKVGEGRNKAGRVHFRVFLGVHDGCDRYAEVGDRAPEICVCWKCF